MSESDTYVVVGEDISKLYAHININNKTKNKLDKRPSDKIEFDIPDLAETHTELSNSDSNLYATLLSIDEIESSLLSSRGLFVSVDDVISENSIENNDLLPPVPELKLMRHNTGPIKKVRAPPPAKPPPYRIRENEVLSQPQNGVQIRRSKSTNSKPFIKFDQNFPIKPIIDNQEDPKGVNNIARKLPIQSFRRPKDAPEKSSGLLVSQSLPLKPTSKPSIPTPFKQSPLTNTTKTLVNTRKQSPPNISDIHTHPTADNSKRISPPITMNNTQQNTRMPPPLNPKPTKQLPSKPPLKPPIKPNPAITAPPPPQNKKCVPLSPPILMVSKHPLRVPPPPPSYSLTLPRNLTDKPPSPTKSPTIGDYTLLTPVSPETSPEDYPAFSPLVVKRSDSPNDHLINDQGYTVLNVDECEYVVDNPPMHLAINLSSAFIRTNSLPPLSNAKTYNNDVISSTDVVPPKKPPRRMTSSKISSSEDKNAPDYAILSSLDSNVSEVSEKQSVTSLIENGITLSADHHNNRNPKMMTISNHGARPVPPKPAAYRGRSQSHNMDLNVKLNSIEQTRSVEIISSDSKPLKKPGGCVSESGILHKMSKRFRNKNRGEDSTPTISNPILGTTGVNKIIGLNTVLVSECVAYLKKPLSLREEGLFRIPGDLNQVKLYHKQFDYSMKPDIDEELDPNNISTLLKQHIRENYGLLPKREASDMYTAVRQKNIEEISSVIERISPEQQFILKEVLYLFKEVSEHEKENKMSTGTIATSCGLSIFPTVNAGNANLMLKILIDNVDEIFKQ